MQLLNCLTVPQPVRVSTSSAFLGVFSNESIKNTFIICFHDVGTLVQGAFMDHKCGIGLILGTGSNACYIEKADRIEKWEGEHRDVKEVVIDNNFSTL